VDGKLQGLRFHTRLKKRSWQRCCFDDDLPTVIMMLPYCLYCRALAQGGRDPVARKHPQSGPCDMILCYQCVRGLLLPLQAPAQINHHSHVSWPAWRGRFRH
jgi:hypothetical protein